jgi:hypothetical protein
MRTQYAPGHPSGQNPTTSSSARLVRSHACDCCMAVTLTNDCGVPLGFPRRRACGGRGRAARGAGGVHGAGHRPVPVVPPLHLRQAPHGQVCACVCVSVCVCVCVQTLVCTSRMVDLYRAQACFAHTGPATPRRWWGPISSSSVRSAYHKGPTPATKHQHWGTWALMVVGCVSLCVHPGGSRGRKWQNTVTVLDTER